MALITVTGYPCSGKSTRTEQFRSFLQSKLSSEDYAGSLKSIEVISDDKLGISRSSYDGQFHHIQASSSGEVEIEIVDSKSEKTARATFFVDLQRKLDKNTIVIADSMNYIKGYRYQIYCAAREGRIRVATVRLLHMSDLKIFNVVRLTQVFTATTPQICKERYLKQKESEPVEGGSRYNEDT